MKFNKSKTACLTGHRPIKLPWNYNENHESCKKFRIELNKMLKEVISKGIKIFLTGMAEGFDMIATEELLSLRKQYNIKIIAIIPCKNQEIKWKKGQQSRYLEILNLCNDRVILSDCYTQNCMNERNRFMVKNSCLVIAGFNGKLGGTFNTIKFALQSNCEIYIINPDVYK